MHPETEVHRWIQAKSNQFRNKIHVNLVSAVDLWTICFAKHLVHVEGASPVRAGSRLQPLDPPLITTSNKQSE